MVPCCVSVNNNMSSFTQVCNKTVISPALVEYKMISLLVAIILSVSYPTSVCGTLTVEITHCSKCSINLAWFIFSGQYREKYRENSVSTDTQIKGGQPHVPLLKS